MEKKRNHGGILADEAAEIAGSVREHLVRLSELGAAGIEVETVDRARKRLAARGVRLNPADALRQLHEDMGDCRRCRLHQGRTNIVFGDGDPYARLMFVGEGPGGDEDAQGVPFVGQAGKQLTAIIEGGMKLQRSEVYIANVVKSRPPDNRRPEPDEIEACLPFLERQIEIIHPEVIVALGAIPARALIGVDTPIGKLRGNWHSFKGIPVMPTYHPSYLLQTPAAKREVWEDIKLVMEKLGLPIGGKT